jgi:hypothetical protein
VTVVETETLPLTTVPGLPALRLIPAPSSEPPYDDELPDGRLHLIAPGGAPALVRAAAPAPALAPVAAPAPALRLVPPVVPDLDDDGPSRTPLADLPPARPFAQALVQRLLEVTAGLRPLGQLQRDTTLELYDRLVADLPAGRRAPAPRPTRRDVLSLHVQARPEGVAEVCATVRRGGRATALALRLEGRSGAWRCTDVAGL